MKNIYPMSKICSTSDLCMTAVLGELWCVHAIFEVFEAVALHVASLLNGKNSVVKIYSADLCGNRPHFCGVNGGEQ